MGRRLVIGIAALFALAVAGVAAAAVVRDHGTVAAFESRLDGHCASVGHRRAEGATIGEPQLRGVVSDDQLECNMLSGFVDVITFRSASARGQVRDACRLGDAEAVVEDLYAPGMGREFRAWCEELDGVMR